MSNPAYTPEPEKDWTERHARAWEDRVFVPQINLYTQQNVMDHLKDVLEAARVTFPGGLLSAILSIEDELQIMLAEHGDNKADPVSCRDVEKFLIPLIRANPEKAAALVANYLRDS